MPQRVRHILRNYLILFFTSLDLDNSIYRAGNGAGIDWQSGHTKLFAIADVARRAVSRQQTATILNDYGGLPQD
jgi:hypothetical protein